MRLACVLLVLAGVAVASVGEASDMEIAIGIKSGMTISSIYGDFGDAYDPKAGLVGGGFVTAYVSDYIGLQAEVLYVMKGARATYQYYDEWGEWYGEYDATFSLDYVEVPLLAKLRIPISSGFSPNVFFGGAVGFNTRAEAAVDEYYYGREEVKIKGVSTIDLGLIVGAGIDVSLEPLFLTGDIRYEIGLLNINDASYWAPCPVADEMNHALILTIGFGLSM